MSSEKGYVLKALVLLFKSQVPLTVPMITINRGIPKLEPRIIAINKSISGIWFLKKPTIRIVAAIEVKIKDDQKNAALSFEELSLMNFSIPSG